jgi:hypothetical protein
MNKPIKIRFRRNPKKEGKESHMLLMATIYFFQNDENEINSLNKQKSFSDKSFKVLTEQQIESFINNAEQYC